MTQFNEQEYLDLINTKSPLPARIKRACEYYNQLLMDNIQNFISEVHPYHDGLSAQRDLAAIDKTIEDRVNFAAHPSDFIRQFKMRKKLNHWRF